MKNEICMLGLAFLMIVCCLCAYGCSENDPYGGLMGKWQDESDDHVIAEFKSDGTYGTLENGSFS